MQIGLQKFCRTIAIERQLLLHEINTRNIAVFIHTLGTFTREQLYWMLGKIKVKELLGLQCQ